MVNLERQENIDKSKLETLEHGALPKVEINQHKRRQLRFQELEGGKLFSKKEIDVPGVPVIPLLQLVTEPAPVIPLTVTSAPETTLIHHPDETRLKANFSVSVEGIKKTSDYIARQVEKIKNTYHKTESQYDRHTLQPVINWLNKLADNLIHQDPVSTKAESVIAFAYLNLKTASLIADIPTNGRSGAINQAMGTIGDEVTPGVIEALNLLVEKKQPQTFRESVKGFWQQFLGRGELKPEVEQQLEEVRSGKKTKEEITFFQRHKSDLKGSPDPIINSDSYAHTFEMSLETPPFYIIYSIFKRMVFERRDENMTEAERQVFKDGKTVVSLDKRQVYYLKIITGNEQYLIPIEAKSNNSLLMLPENSENYALIENNLNEILWNMRKDFQGIPLPKEVPAQKQTLIQKGFVSPKIIAKELNLPKEEKKAENIADLTVVISTEPKDLDIGRLQKNALLDPTQGSSLVYMFYTDREGKVSKVGARYNHRDLDGANARHETMKAIQKAASFFSQQKFDTNADNRKRLFFGKTTPYYPEEITDIETATIDKSFMGLNDDLTEVSNLAAKYGTFIGWNTIYSLALMEYLDTPNLHFLEATKSKGLAPSLYWYPLPLIRKLRDGKNFSDEERMVFDAATKLQAINRKLTVNDLGPAPVMDVATKIKFLGEMIKQTTPYLSTAEDAALRKSFLFSTMSGNKEAYRSVIEQDLANKGEEQLVFPDAFTTIFTSYYQGVFGGEDISDILYRITFRSLKGSGINDAGFNYLYPLLVKNTVRNLKIMVYDKDSVKSPLSQTIISGNK